MSAPVYIGIAGWSYPDWKGIVYTQPGKDQLKYVSRYVDCIEINSTFYRPPNEGTTQSWLERVAQKEGFFFTAKLHKSFTHEGKIDLKVVKQFHTGFGPLLEAGKLKKLLVQFRYDFDDNKNNRSHLTKIVKSFSDSFDLAIELRHKSWEQSEALEFLERSNVSVCNLDYPVMYNSFNLKNCFIGKSGYFRLHGRNSEKWFSKEAGRDETYDYYYTAKELDQIKVRIEQLAMALEYLIVVTNNHYKGAELANAIELKCLLSRQKREVPEGLLETYPELSKVASNKQLF